MELPKSHEEWLALRLKGIGASEASAVIGCNPYMSNQDLWEIKTGRKQAEDISNKDCVVYGHAAEAPIRELFALDYADKYEVTYGGEFDMVYHLEYPWLFATLDGRLVERETGRKGVLEIKTTNIVQSMQKEKWFHDGKPCIPQNYYVQNLHQLLSTGFDFVVLHAQLRFEYGGDIRSERRSYFIERNEVKDDLDFLLGKEIEFWNMVQDGRKPGLILPEI